MPAYHPQRIEPKWQAYWEHAQTFRAPDLDITRPKLYVLDMFPYPSGAGLHVGHPEGYTATDIICRYKRMRGYNVLHPMGWDAFGLPAEQYAIQTGTHPKVTTQANIDTFRRQIKSLGFSYDWSREVDTTDPAYYKWTQWIFLQIYDTWYDPDREWIDAKGVSRKGRGRPIAELPIPAGTADVESYKDSKRLAYRAEVPVNWCAGLGTVLANEEVIDGKSERGGFPVVRMPLKQWMLRITAYADRLVEDLDGLDWSKAIKDMQRNWVGRSEGALVDFAVQGLDDHIRVFTTRPDTLFGATYMVLAPEHPLVDKIAALDRQHAVDDYRRSAAGKSDFDRSEMAKLKTGVDTGAFALNPVNGEPIPIWIADYVLMGYGTGAIMAVPGHDERDHEFARKFGLPIVRVVAPEGEISRTEDADPTIPRTFEEMVRRSIASPTEPVEAFVGQGVAVNSQNDTLILDGLPTAAAKSAMIAWLEARGAGRKTVNTKLRDWLFSRQRYWGEPFPILLGEGDAHRAVPEAELPVLLPEVDDYLPSGRPEPPLGKATEWVKYSDAYRRETNTMPQWAGSCWYYLRYLDPKNADMPFSPELEKYWMPVDLYVGGAEHAVLHLLYSRFWHKVMFDRGWVSTVEPFQKLVNQGMILGETEYTGYQDASGAWTAPGPDATPVKLDEPRVVKKGDGFVLADDPSVKVDARAHKMSKARGNVINPDVVVAEFGADSLRLFEMFMGPLEAVKPWSMKGVEGVYRFLGRAWRLVADHEAAEVRLDPRVRDVEPTPEQRKVIARAVAAVTDDLERLSFNTAVSRLMEYANVFTTADVRPKSAMETFSLLLAPLAPHLAEELWELLGHANTLAYEPWPTYDPALLVDDEVEVALQLNGKVKGRASVPAGSDAAALEAAARADPAFAALLAGKAVRKVVAVPGKLVNFVVG